jgi:hypothetical protein
VDEGILTRHNLALRLAPFERALVTKEFKNFVELLRPDESLTTT